MGTFFATARQRLRHVGLVWWAVPLLAVALCAGLSRVHALDAFERVFYDLRLQAFTPPPREDPHFLWVQIDDVTLHDMRTNPTYPPRFGVYPYDRRLWLRLAKYMLAQGARAVVMDAVMDEPQSDESGDAGLAHWIQQSQAPFYLGVAVGQLGEKLPAVHAVNAVPGKPAAAPAKEASADVELDTSGDDSGIGEPVAPKRTPEQIAAALAFPVEAQGVSPAPLVGRAEGRDGRVRLIAEQLIPPIPELIGAVPGFGLVRHEDDPDGKMRRTHLAFTDGANTYVTLSTAVAADLLGAEKLVLRPGQLELGGRTLAIDEDGSAGLDFRGPLSRQLERVSLVRVLDDSVHAENKEKTALPQGLFRDRIVLIGGSSVGTYDVKSTPFESNVSGMAKPFAELRALLEGDFITRAPFALPLALALVLSLLTALAVWASGSAAVEIGVPALAGAALFVGTGLLLARAHQDVAFVMPFASLVLSGAGAAAVDRLALSRDRERLKASFGRFLSPQVVAQLIDQPELPRLDGEEREITAFFSDIKGFSTFSEGFKHDPRGLVQLLNTYLTRVSGTLLEHGGCLDKYIGDAVVCIFGAPLSMEDHATRACLAAIRVQEEIGKLRAEFKKQGLPDVYTRIGLNSARMFVGNFGSEQLFNYTAMGDGMNLASRLEGANKPYGSLIMIGENTYAKAKDHVEARHLDRVRVAGKKEPVDVYELLTRKGELAAAKREAVRRYEEALRLFLAGRFSDAQGPLEEALRVEPDDAPSRALLERARKYALHPPEDFDGVTNLEK